MESCICLFEECMAQKGKVEKHFGWVFWWLEWLLLCVNLKWFAIQIWNVGKLYCYVHGKTVTLQNSSTNLVSSRPHIRSKNIKSIIAFPFIRCSHVKRPFQKWNSDFQAKYFLIDRFSANELTWTYKWETIDEAAMYCHHALIVWPHKCQFISMTNKRLHIPIFIK